MLHTLSHRFALPRQEVALLLITIVWGAAFLAIHIGLVYSGPLFLVGLRFAVAGAISLMLFRKCMRDLNWHEIRGGCAIGVSIFLGYSLQTDGLKYITISQSAFITALYVPAVPLFQWLILRSAPHPMAWGGVVLALSGLFLLSGMDSFHAQMLGYGELLTLLGALAIAAEIVLIGQYAGRVDLRRITVVQLIAASVLAFIAMPVANEKMPAFSWVWLACAGGLGAASVLIQLVMNWAQREVSPTRATLIYASEPIWAGAIGWLVGERLPPLAWLGGMLVVLAVVVSEWRPGRQGPNA